MRNIYSHFTRIASRYNDLRSIDTEPLLFIKQKLKDLAIIRAADIGCGTGNYDMELSSLFGNKLMLSAIDLNENMLSVFDENLSRCNITNISIVKSLAERLPLADKSLDCTFSFNAVHHFDLERFLNEVSRCLKANGYMFIYTRLRSQNKKNIWGSYFPKFLEKEKSLYEVDEIRQIVKKIPSMELDSIKYFIYKFKSSLNQLLLQAENHHYSTFSLYYEPDEFKESLLEFKKNIKNNFENIHEIIYENANTMFVIRKINT